jgi:hypothetical protein
MEQSCNQSLEAEQQELSEQTAIIYYYHLLFVFLQRSAILLCFESLIFVKKMKQYQFHYIIIM